MQNTRNFALQVLNQPDSVVIDEKSRLRALLAASRLNPLDPAKISPACIWIVKEGRPPAIWGSFGNISVIKAKAKGKKSMLASLLTGAAIKNGILSETIKCYFPPEKHLIGYFDTEQDDEMVKWNVRRSLIMAGGVKEEQVNHVHTHWLREHPPEDRLGIIGQYLEDTPGVGLLVIDGIRDLLYDINDPKESTRVAQALMTWSKQYHVHILTVIHQNKNDNNARGHIGTEIINKAETVADVTKDGEDAVVSASDCRHMEFDEFRFCVDGEGVPRILEGYENDDKKKKSPSKPEEIVKEWHDDILTGIFSRHTTPNHTIMVKSVQILFGERGITLSEKTSRAFVEYYVLHGFIQESVGPKNSRVFKFK